MMATNSSFRCSNGLMIPTYVEADWPEAFRACLYLIALLYTFLGIAVISDVFMCAIERITTATRMVPVGIKRGQDGDYTRQYKKVLLWNPTVANLSLMALGTSAPEIMVALIEVIGNNFHAGELGPGTVVGSAAFNLMMINAVCILAVPKHQIRRIEKFPVFCLSAFWNVFAYIWLLIILLGISKDEVEIWEGIVTVLFFFTSILTAYLVDKQFYHQCCPSSRNRTISIAPLTDMSTDVISGTTESECPPEWLNIERRARLNNPDMKDEDLAKIVALKINNQRKKSYLERRIDVIRSLVTRSSSLLDSQASTESDGFYSDALELQTVEFSATTFCINPIMDKEIQLKIIRRGPLGKITFRCKTVNGTAKENVHFLPQCELYSLEQDETALMITINLIEGAEWKPEDMFSIKLELFGENSVNTRVGRCSSAEVICTKDDIIMEDGNRKACEVEFMKHCVNVKNSQAIVRLLVTRSGNYREAVTIGYITEGVNVQLGNAIAGSITIEPHQVQTYFDIPIVGNNELEKEKIFLVRLLNPSANASIGPTGVTIVNNDEFVRIFDKLDLLVPKILKSLKPGKQSWHGQFRRHLNVNGGDPDNATTTDYFLHVLSFPWKAICAFVPPPLYFGGWLTFLVSLGLIAFITVLVIDTAKTFGCLIHLDDSVTAITLVAVGSSLPDTFASRISAIQDKTADNAIGNVNGSNITIVFLGLGLPWLIASIYWASKGHKFTVPSGDIGFTVTIYTICAIITLTLMFIRRYSTFFGRAELGGPIRVKKLCFIGLTVLWLLYIVLSSFEQYGYIPRHF